jgi:hypothetical protein
MSEKKELSLLHGFMDFVYQPQLIKEFKDSNNGKVMMKGILQRADTVNQNGRIYPRDILAREVRNYQKLIRENRSLGELDHPDTSVVELKNVSHIVKSAEMDQDGVVHGEVEILNTPAGKILQNLIESGVKLGISSRGVGSTKRDGDYDVVQEDFQLICWGAYMLSEGKKINRDALDSFFTDSDKIDRIANDILLHLEENKK